MARIGSSRVTRAHVRFAPLLAVVLVALLAAPALAAGPTASTITSPSDPALIFRDQDGSGGTVVLSVDGTTTGVGNVDLRCYDAIGNSWVAAADVPVTANHFHADITNAHIGAQAPCVLRAVPVGDSVSQPPGTSSPYSGLRVLQAYRAWDRISGGPNDGKIFDLSYLDFGDGGALKIGSAGTCAVGMMGLLNPTTLVESPEMFGCIGRFSPTVRDAVSPGARSEIQVDGVNAYPPYSAILKAPDGYQTPGFVPVSVTDAYDPATGDLIVKEKERLLRCLPDDFTCSSFSPLGVELDRLITTSAQQRDVTETDTWRSVDGSQHALDALYDDETGEVSPNRTSFDFPGSSGFQTYDHGDQVTLPRGPGSILVKDDSTTPDAGDGVNPQGALTYASAPDGPLVFHFSDSGGTDIPEWTMPYARTIPAGGQMVLRFGVADALSLADVEGFAQATLAGFAPSLSIDFPANGAVVHKRSLVVSGKAVDAAGVALTVNGQATSVASNGAWLRQMNLTPGTNTVTAVATDPDGFMTQRQVSFTYVPAKVSVGAIKRLKNGVRIRLSCANDVCSGVGALTVRERMVGRKIKGLFAKRRKARVKKVRLAHKSFLLQPGQTTFLTLKLNATGRKLLARFKKLPLRVKVTQTVTGAGPVAVKNSKLTLKAPRKHRRKH